MHEARFLGGASLRLNDAPVGGSAAQRHPLALLAILAAHPVREVTRDQLVAFLWPDRESRRARHLLSEALYQLRNTAGRDAIRSVGNALTLNPSLLWSDVRAFGEAMDVGDHRTAVELYEGRFLEGFHLSDDGEFQPWADGRRAQLEADYAVAVDALVDEATAAGNHLEAAHWLRLRRIQDPFSGASTRKLMASLARAGDRAEAIRIGREYETRIRDELGLPPAEEVTRLRARLESPHWIARRQAPVRWQPGVSPDRRAVPRGTPAPVDDDLDILPAPSTPDIAPLGSDPWVGESEGAAATRAALLVLVVAAALLAFFRLSPRVFRSPEARGPHHVAVLPLSSCCTEALSAQVERYVLILADTLAQVPGNEPLEPARVVTAWREAAPTSAGASTPERFAAKVGADRYLSGSVLQVGPSEVRVELALWGVGDAGLIYSRRGSTKPEETGALIENLAAGLADYLRGEAAGRALASF